jgi:hypothetical protein
MNRINITNALERYGYNYLDRNGKIIVKLDYAQHICIDVTNPHKVIIQDKLVAWNFLTGSIQMSIKNAMLYNFAGVLLFTFILIYWENHSHVLIPLYIGFIAWVIIWTIFYHVKSENFKQLISHWTT